VGLLQRIGSFVEAAILFDSLHAVRHRTKMHISIKQLIIGTACDNSTLIENEDYIAAPHCRETVSHKNHRLVAVQIGNGVYHQSFSYVI
jgi:hypothetical protein